MDKHEYRIILEEINKAYLEENYDRVLMIAQELDVNKISDNHILEIIADSYEKMGRADIAREVLLIAYERTPMGRQMAYKLCDISIKLNDLDNAAEFYHDFCRMAPNDSKKYILKYEIGKKGGVARKNLVEVLESYCDKEMDEKYKYELANLYRATGRKEECIELCDEIMLWFADGAYAKKAQKLKDACLGIMQQNQGMKKRGTLSLFDDENIEDIPDEKAKKYTQPKSEEIFDDAPAVEIQRLEDRPLMNENVSWRMPNKKYDPVITEPEPRPAQRLAFSDFDDSYEEKKDDYENYYHDWKGTNDTNENDGSWTMIEESIQRGWTDPEDAYESYDDYEDYDTTWEMPEDILEPIVEEEFVEPVFGAHRPAHLRDDYNASETGQQPTVSSSPFAMPDRMAPPASPAYQTQVMPQAPAYQAPAYQAPAYQAPAYQAPAYQAPAYEPLTYTQQGYGAGEYAQPAYEEQAYAMPQEQIPAEPSLLGAKPFAFSIAPEAAAQNEIVTTAPQTVENIPNISEKASLVKKPTLKVGPVNEIKYKIPGGEYQKPVDVPVVPLEQAPVQEIPQNQMGTFTSSTQRQTSIPAPKVLNPEPVKVVMSPDGTQSNLTNKNEKISLGWDDNWGGDFKTWGSLNMDDAPAMSAEIDDEPDYFSTMLEIPRDKPTYSKGNVPFAQQVPQTKFVELKSGTPFADPNLNVEKTYEEEKPIEYIPKRAGVYSAALGKSTVANIASEPEENLTETQKAIRAFVAGELTTDDLLERDDLDLGDDELEEEVKPSDYGYNDEWQESEKMSYSDEPSELRRFRNSSERFDFEEDFDDYDEPEYEDGFIDEYDDGPEFTEAEKAIMAFDAMNKSDNEVDFFEEEEEDFEPEPEISENAFVDYESEFDEFDDQFEDKKKPKVIEEEWTDSEIVEENPVLETSEEVEEYDEEPESFEEEFEENFEEEFEDDFEDDYEDEYEDQEEFEDDFEEVEESEPEPESELSDAEKAILAFEAANVMDDEDEFDFDEDFDDVFNGDFNGEFTKEPVEEEIPQPELKDVFAEPEDQEEFEENFEETEEFSDEYEEKFEEEYDDSEEFDEEYNESEEFDEEYDDSEEFDEEYNEEYDESNEFEEEYDETEEYDEYDEYDEAAEFEDELEEGEVLLEEAEEPEELEETEEVVEEAEPEEAYENEEAEPEETYENEEAKDETESEETKEPEEEQEIPDMEVGIPDELREELSEFFLVEGMEEKIQSTLSDIVNAKNKGHKLDANLIVAGDPKSGKTYLTIALIKTIGKILGNGNGRVAKVPAAALRGKKMEKVFEKVTGSDLIIENIGYLDDETVKDLIETLKTNKVESMVVLEGNNLAIENLTNKFPEIAELFKNRLDIDELSLPQWADIANSYALEQGYIIGDMASLALHAKIDELNVPTRRLGTADVLEIVDEAIENANQRMSPKLIKKKRKKEENIELVEDDFQ